MPRIPGSTTGRRNNENSCALLFIAGQAPTKRNFTLTIPPVPDKAVNAIERRITKNQPWIGQKAKLDLAQQKAQNLRMELNHMHDKLDDIEQRHGQKIHDLEKVKEVELKIALEEIGKKSKSSCQDRLNGKEQEWDRQRKDLKKQMEEELRKIRTELETIIAKEPPAKRRKVESTEDNLANNETIEVLPEEDKQLKQISIFETEEDEKLSSEKLRELLAYRQKAEDLKETKKDMGKLLVMIMKAEKKKKEEAGDN